MKLRTAFFLLAAGALGFAPSSIAQISLDNFSSFQSNRTFFFGSWSGSGDPFSGDLTPVSTFSQGTGFYNFASASTSDSAFVERVFLAPIDVGINNQLTLSLRLLDDNTAASLTVFLIDGESNTASATFLTTDFNVGSFATQSLVFTAAASFDASAVNAFRVTGNDPFGDPFSGPFLSVSIDQLWVTSSAVAVPEPATWAFASIALLALLIARRRNR